MSANLPPPVARQVMRNELEFALDEFDRGNAVAVVYSNGYMRIAYHGQVVSAPCPDETKVAVVKMAELLQVVHGHEELTEEEQDKVHFLCSASESLRVGMQDD